uniref:Uncharacterized protein n=1 Tax=Aureoumbra lagunensis TaxID=44058 RepID=A0A7S3K1R2_9STRA|mmetsp:Transcript_5198/g.7721  ORF Transcript_5198/g.7721 Transcript_5198/m.7721 type:complete len:476 (+) Transcript_5198:85-1512(+)
MKWIKSAKTRAQIGPKKKDEQGEWCRGWPLLHEKKNMIPIISQVTTLGNEVHFDIVDCNLQKKIEQLAMWFTFKSKDVRDAVAWTLGGGFEGNGGLHLLDTNRIRVVWKPSLEGVYIVEPRLLYFGKDQCGHLDEFSLYLGSFQQRATHFDSPNCDKLSFLAMNYSTIEIKFEKSHQGNYHHLPQCRDGKTTNGVWLEKIEKSVGDALARLQPFLNKRYTAKKSKFKWDAITINSAQEDTWFFEREDCFYSYFSPRQAKECLNENIIIFLGDSIVRLVHVAFAHYLGVHVDDQNIKQDPDRYGTVQISNHLHIAYLMMWEPSDFYRRALPDLKKNWLQRIHTQGSVIVVANFGVIHQLFDTCDNNNTFASNLQKNIDTLSTIIFPATLHLILIAPTFTNGNRVDQIHTTRSQFATKIMSQHTTSLNDNNTRLSFLDLNHLTTARFDGTKDGVHFTGSSLAASALILLNMLCTSSQ